MSSTKVIISSYAWMTKEEKKEVKESRETFNACIDLKEYAKDIAKTELREDDITRETCLQQFREWILQNRDIENCVTDDNFLLRFLRTKKFSLPMAQQQLLKYLNFRCKFKHLFFNLDYEFGNVCQLIDSGYIYVSPFRDSGGKRVIIAMGGKLDAQKYSYEDMARAHMITYETLMSDEHNQILGVTHVGDGEGVSMSHVVMWPPTEFATVIKWGDQSFPMRHKQIYATNVPSTLKHVLDFTCSRVSPKVAGRLKICSNNEELHNYLDKRVLPRELGGEMPQSEMVALWKQELAASKPRLLSYDTMNLLSDQGIARSRNRGPDMTGTGSLAGSFRKLEID